MCIDSSHLVAEVLDDVIRGYDHGKRKRLARYCTLPTARRPCDVCQQEVRKSRAINDRVIEILVITVLCPIDHKLGRANSVLANTVRSPDTLRCRIEFGNQETVFVYDVLVALDFGCRLEHRQTSFIESRDAVMLQDRVGARLRVECSCTHLHDLTKWNFPPIAGHLPTERLEVHEPRPENDLRYLR